MAYGWITYAQAKRQLAARLADPQMVRWIDAELGVYLCEALRVWNVLTLTWKTPFTLGIAAASQPTWLSLGTVAGSPRLRTLTDVALYIEMQYHLLEPPSGATWTGTSQFAIADLSLALQRCRDEAIQVTNCNQVNLFPVAGVPNVREFTLPDTALDIARARWVPAVGPNSTLMRNDETGFNYYQTGYLQSPSASPEQYNIATLTPLVLQVDIAPVQPGALDLIVLQSGDNLTPPSGTLLNVPDDFNWVLKWGALADALGRESEATDLLRASYCQKRYNDGLQLMQATPWVIEAQINGVPAVFVPVSEQDWYKPEWDSKPGDLQTVVTAGMDFFTVVPDPANDISVTLTVLGNAPVPVVDGDFIQCSRDVWDTILDYAQFLAAFKHGGAEFIQAQQLEQGFFDTAAAINGRLKKLGLFAALYTDEGKREVRAQERFAKQ